MECISACSLTSSAGSSSSYSSKGNKMMSNEKKGSVKKSNKGVMMKLSTDPQSVAARKRRHRISDRFKILQTMVPGGSNMDTASLLDEAIHYVKFLNTQILLHQTIINFVLHHHHSPMLLPPQNYYFPYEQAFPLQQNNSVSLNEHSLHQTLPQLPLDQCCFLHDEENTTFDANMKSWPAYS